MKNKDLKNLPPDECILQAKELLKKLEKEIEKGKKEKRKAEELKKLAQEVEELQEIIHEAEEEIRGQRKWKEKVPIAETAKEELEGLSEEGREVVRALRGIQQRKPEEKEETLKSKKKEANLEETVWQEKKSCLPKHGECSTAHSNSKWGEWNMAHIVKNRLEISIRKLLH